MNLAYYRKSTFNREETLENVKNNARSLGFHILGETELPNKKGAVLHICNSTWMGNLIASDKNLIGLLPCSVVVIDQNEETVVGVGSPSVLGSISQNPAISQIASQAQEKLTELVNTSAGVGPLKPIGIKLYATTSCPYCKMEAAWLSEKKVDYSEVHVDLDQKEAEEMVRKTGQMGVPVTAIQYEGGEEEYIVGFDREKLSAILDIKN